MKTVLINVTKEDIADGIPRSCRRKLRTSVSVDNFIGTRMFTVKTPRKALSFITRFDDFKPVKPFRFKLTIP